MGLNLWGWMGACWIERRASRLFLYCIATIGDRDRDDHDLEVTWWRFEWM